MSAFEGLLSAIRDEPEGDEPRLILADWLEDHGEQERAEFIRVQCVLARLPLYHDFRPELEARERGLLLLHENEWTGLPADRGAVGVLHRGFLEELTIPASLLLRSPAAFLGSQLVRELTVQVEDLPEIERLAELPHLRSLRRLNLKGTQLHRTGLAALFESPHLQQLTGLGLHFDSISRSGLRRLAGAFVDLRELDLSRSYLDVDSFAALLPTEASKLERLVLDRTRLQNADVELLAQCPYLGKLRDLSLHGVSCGVGGLTALTWARFAAGLESLGVGGDFGPCDPALLLRGEVFSSLRRLELRWAPQAWYEPPSPAPRHPTLRELILTWPHFLPEGMDSWLRQSALPALEELTLISETSYQGNEVPPDLLDALSVSPGLHGLRHLRLQAIVTVEDFARLLSGPHAARWRSLEVVDGLLGGGLAPLVEGRYRPALSQLVLTNCGLRDDDVTLLADCECLSDLRQLGLAGNWLGNDSARRLAQSPYLKRLIGLDLQRNRITDAEPFVGTYLANPAILYLADNPLSSGQEALLRSGAEVMRRLTVAPILALLAEQEAGS
jgi:uncharacterized protein (TIGR02996 family)